MSKDILRGVSSLAHHIRDDFQAANKIFGEGCANLAVLSNPPHPVEMIGMLEDQFPEYAASRKVGLISLPSFHTFNYPANNLTISEARRTYTAKEYTRFWDIVVGLHLFATSGYDALPDSNSQYYYAVSTFKPRHEPFPLLNKAQTDTDLNPNNVIAFYRLQPGWQQFMPDQIPEAIPKEVAEALKRAGLL